MHKSNKHRKVARFMLSAAVASLLCVAAFAVGENTIVSGIKGGMSQIYTILTSIVVPIAVISFAIAAFQFFVNGEKGVETAKKIAIYTIIGIAAVYLAPMIIKEVAGWFSSSGTVGVFS